MATMSDSAATPTIRCPAHIQVVAPLPGETEAEARIRFERILCGAEAPESGAWLVRYAASGERILTGIW